MKKTYCYIDSNNNFRFSIPNFDNKIFNDWLDSDVQNSLNIVKDINKAIKKIMADEVKKDEFWGNDMVLFLDKEGARVRCNLAYDQELGVPDEFPMSDTMPLDTFNYLINYFLEHPEISDKLT